MAKANPHITELTTIFYSPGISLKSNNYRQPYVQGIADHIMWETHSRYRLPYGW